MDPSDVAHTPIILGPRSGGVLSALLALVILYTVPKVARLESRGVSQDAETFDERREYIRES